VISLLLQQQQQQKRWSTRSSWADRVQTLSTRLYSTVLYNKRLGSHISSKFGQSYGVSRGWFIEEGLTACNFFFFFFFFLFLFTTTFLVDDTQWNCAFVAYRATHGPTFDDGRSSRWTSFWSKNFCTAPDMTTVEKRCDNLYQVQTDTRSSFGSVRCLVVDYFVHCICYFLGSEKLAFFFCCTQVIGNWTGRKTRRLGRSGYILCRLLCYYLLLAAAAETNLLWYFTVYVQNVQEFFEPRGVWEDVGFIIQ